MLRTTRAGLKSLLPLLLFCTAGAGETRPISCGPYLQNPGKTQMTVMWTSDLAAEGVVRYDAGGPTGKEVMVKPREFIYPKEAPRYRINLEELTPDQQLKAYAYEARLEGLAPGTVYKYTVEFSGQKAEGSFRTFPDKPEPFTFIDFGDTHYKDAVAGSFAKHNPAFLINTGDLTNHEHYAEYRMFFSPAITAAAGRAPLFVARGNHDETGTVLSQIFSIPGGKLYYSFDYGNAHFVCLDAELWRGKDSKKDIKPMLEWCEQDLKASRAEWKIAFFHEPPYDMSDIRAAANRNLFMPVFRRCGVDLTLSGHAHAYQRFRPLFWPGQNDQHPVTVISSGGGMKGGAFARRADPHLSVRYTGSHYLACTIDGGKLTVRALTTAGKEIDNFTIVKQDGRIDPAYLAQALPEEPFGLLERDLAEPILPKPGFAPGETFVIKVKLHAGSQAMSFDLAPAESSAKAVELVEPAKGEVPANGSVTVDVKLRAKAAIAGQKGGRTAPEVVLECSYQAGSLKGVVSSEAAAYKLPTQGPRVEPLIN